MTSAGAVTFVLVRPDGKVLMQLRDDGGGKDILYPNMWCLPGGGKEGEESHIETAIREIKEEFNLDINKSNCRQAIEYNHDGYIQDAVFICQVSQDTKPELHEGRAIQWMAFEEIEKLTLAWEQKAVLPQLKNHIEALTAKRDTKAAFLWIIGLLNKHTIPFQIAGGFAARLYGSDRELADIDIGIPDNRFDDLYPEVKEFITFGPAQYHDDEWDLKLMTLTYKGQEIDIAGEDTVKMFDKTTKTWISVGDDFSKSIEKEAYGLIVPVIPKDKLIAYKKKIMREVDIEDITFLEGRN